MERMPVGAADLADDDLIRELTSLHRTRTDALRHGSDDALRIHTERTAALESEYLRRWPQREVDPARTRDGARDVAGAVARTQPGGADVADADWAGGAA